MYYDNKSSFYIRQYGPAVIICVISLVLITSGVFLYIQSTNNLEIVLNEEGTKLTEIAQVEENVNIQIEEEVQLSNTIEEETITEENALAEVVTTSYFEELPTYEKSKDLNVVDISDSGEVTVELNGEKLKITLIGVNFKTSHNTIYDVMKKDLLNEKIRIAFDNIRNIEGTAYAYLFKGDTLYNSELLEKGLATLKTERENIQLNNKLATAQSNARKNSLGVWN